MHTDDTFLPPARPPADAPPAFSPSVSAPVRPGPQERGGNRAVAIVVAIVTVVGALAVVGISQGSSAPFYADHWDSRIAPIARDVARLRGLEFTHAVPVRFLSEAEFKKKVGLDDASLDATSRAQLERSAAMLRSVGLLAGDADLRNAIDTASTSGFLAYYDPAREEIVVRGNTLDVGHRATLAHELTHVLQDQHFDLQKREREADTSKTGDAEAMRALIEGDAMRIEDDYVSHLSDAEQKEYDRQTASDQDQYQAESGKVPDIVDIEFGAPYIFGPSTIEMLVAEGGNRAVDRAFTGPIPASRMFVEPGVLEAPAVTAPLPPPGVGNIGDSQPLGPLDLYLMLAGKTDAQTALRAADLVTSGRSIAYHDRVRNVDCFEMRFAAQPGDDARLAAALRQWAQGVPTAKISDGTTLTACDPGKTVKGPAAGRLDDAVQLLALRSQLSAEIADSGAPAEKARCVARLFVRRPGMVALAFKYTDTAPTGADAQKFTSAVAADTMSCIADDSAGLP